MQFFIDNALLIAVAFMSGGMLLWPLFRARAAGPALTTLQATQLINGKHAQVVDVRDAAEVARGSLHNAKRTRTAAHGRCDLGVSAWNAARAGGGPALPIGVRLPAIAAAASELRPREAGPRGGGITRFSEPEQGAVSRGLFEPETHAAVTNAAGPDL